MLDGQVGPEPCIPDWGVMPNSPCLSPWLLRPASYSQQPLHLLEGHLFTQQTFVYTYGVPETLVGTGATAGTERGFGHHAAHVPEGGGRVCWVRGEAVRTSAEVRGPLGEFLQLPRSTCSASLASCQAGHGQPKTTLGWRLFHPCRRQSTWFFCSQDEDSSILS